MSTPNTEVLGIQVSAPGGIHASVPGVHVSVPGADVLPFTGTGPGTLPLVIVGLVSIIVGGIATLTSRKGGTARVAVDDDTTSPLRDLASMAHGPLR